MKLEDICLSISDGTHSSIANAAGTSYYLLSCKNVKDGRIVFDKSDRTISKDDFMLLRKRTQTSINDIVLSSVGTIGEVSIIKDEPSYEFQRSVAILKPNHEIVLPQFLLYLFMSRKGQEQIKSRIKGAAQPCLFLNDIRDMDFDIPSFSIQQHIVNTTIGGANYAC